MKKIFLSIFIAFFSIAAFGTEQRQELQEKAKTQIIRMKQSIMLVRLSDKAPVIKALEEKGMEQRAKAVKARQDAVNKEIISSFSGFDFCEVYFFYSHDSENLQQGKFNKVTLYSGYELIAKEVELDSNFFVTDFGMLRNEKELKTETKQKEKSRISKQKKYKGSDVNTMIKCMYLRDHNFKQLDAPFPYYVRFHPTPIQNLSYRQVIDKMNKQLTKFSQQG